MKEFKSQFRDALVEPLRAAGLEARVFIWTKFHDRYLLSNLVGISLPYGFGTGPGRTTSARLRKADCDDIQREFDPNSQRRKLVSNFTIP